jgi:hypothetical protein
MSPGRLAVPLSDGAAPTQLSATAGTPTNLAGCRSRTLDSGRDGAPQGLATAEICRSVA